MNPVIDMSPMFLGSVARSDLLSGTAALGYRTRRDDLVNGEGLVFRVEGDGFRLGLTLEKGIYTLTRNDHQVIIRPPFSSNPNPWTTIVECTPTRLQIGCGPNSAACGASS